MWFIKHRLLFVCFAKFVDFASLLRHEILLHNPGEAASGQGVSMRSIVKADIIDIVPYEQGFLYIEKQEMADGCIKALFFAYDQERNTIFPVKRKDYLLGKFGVSYARIAQNLEDFVFCETEKLYHNILVVLYPDGRLLQFTPAGEKLREETLLYQEAPMVSPNADGQNLWCIVPRRNAVVQYSFTEKRVLLRIGGGSSNAFNCPVSMNRFLDKLYVCSRDAYKVRTVALDNYTVKDYVTLQEPVYQYFRVYAKEYVHVTSGVYRL